uniref:AlNc14C137G7110 protein n=1 Tax=Albugo laibachii Nc14 TaxID=890382 RepID=F0WKS0_9STRA|nr:AlNc14C137G7110 [Albugo laibachii Nc14]|eukprot:CCA21877.1 AlNc14C137G7110 [Albugo laibachii Nc14]
MYSVILQYGEEGDHQPIFLDKQIPAITQVRKLNEDLCSWFKCSWFERSLEVEVEVVNRLQYEFGHGNNVIGWEVDEISLSKWTKTTELHISETSIMSVEAYLHWDNGFYTLTWTEEESYRLNFRISDETLRSRQPVQFHTLGDQFMVSVVFDGVVLENQRVRINFDDEVTSSKKIFQTYSWGISKTLWKNT